MLVPRFALSQTKVEVVVTVKLPYVRVGDAELSVDGQEFAFYCKPYLLKLHFPHALRGSEEDEGRHCRAVYDADLDHGTMTLHLAKAQPGQDFPDLDLTTSLLQPVGAYDPTGSTAAGGAGGGAAACEPPRIEVLRSEEYMPSPSSSSPSPAEGEGASAAAAAAAASDEKRETQPQPGSAAASAEGLLPTLAGIAGVRPPRYGFNRAYAGVFRHLRDEMAEVLRVPDPEGTPEGIRTLLREAEEAAQFDGERYLGDLVDGEEDPLYQEAMAMTPFYLHKPTTTTSTEGGGAEWAAEEQEELAGLTNREFLPFESPEETRAVALGLLDLLLAFAYDHRTTGGEPTVESCWTLATLSPALCWLETYHPRPDVLEEEEEEEESAGDDGAPIPSPPPPSAAAVIRSFYRRSLTYPYLRVWRLSARCVADARAVLLGADTGSSRRLALRCLLRVRRMLRRTEAHYLLNRIFLDDYCAFLQQRERAEPVLALLRAELEGEAATMVGKGGVGLDLLGLEALLVDGKEEEEEEEEEEESSESGSESEDGESESGSGSEGSETDENDDDDDDEEEEGGNVLVAGLQRVRLVEEAAGTGAGTGTGAGADSGRTEGQEDDAGLAGQLAALSVGGAKPRETLEVRPPPSLLLAPQQPEGEALPEEGKRRRPLVEELLCGV